MQSIGQVMTASVNRTRWAMRVQDAWPDAEKWVRTSLIKVLSNPNCSSDALLLLADGLDEAAREEATFYQRMHLARGLSAVACLLRDEAPKRAPGDGPCL
ncbi:MAG: hypothetical protein AB7F35_06535 [Acetobacteraceae bacterium]